MRRTLIFVTATALALSLAGCNRNRGATADAGAGTATTGATTDQATGGTTRPGGADWEQMKAKAEERWKSADTDGDDALSRTETASAMPEIEKQFDKFDGNGDGKISRDEIHNFKLEDASG